MNPYDPPKPTPHNNENNKSIKNMDKRTKNIAIMLLIACVIGSSYGAALEFIKYGSITIPTIIGSIGGFIIGIVIIYYVIAKKLKLKSEEKQT